MWKSGRTLPTVSQPKHHAHLRLLPLLSNLLASHTSVYIYIYLSLCGCVCTSSTSAISAQPLVQGILYKDVGCGGPGLTSWS